MPGRASAPLREPRQMPLAFQRPVVRRALLMAAIVGPVLALINHGDKLLAGTLTPTDLFKITLTVVVPYSVSTISSVLAIREQRRLIARLTCKAEVGEFRRVRSP